MPPAALCSRMSHNAPLIPPAAAKALAFDAVLTPHRSLSPLGFYAVMAVAAGASLVLSIAFFLMGAWPVVGFFGLDVALLYIAFRLSYRSGRLTEIVQLTRDALTVRRVAPSGRRSEWRSQPTWLRVEIDDPPRHDSQLVLASHGRRLTVGAFLTAPERFEVAEALRAALRSLRCRPAPSPSG